MPAEFDRDKPYMEYPPGMFPHRYRQDGKYFLNDGRECFYCGLVKDKSAIDYESGESMKYLKRASIFRKPGRLRNKRGAK